VPLRAGRHHLQNLMTVGGLEPRRALESRHLLASMLAPDPEHRPDAEGVTTHPLFWDDDRAMRQTVALHARSASCQTEMGTMLSNVATEALLNGSSGGNSERGALLAAASMDLTDWQRRVDPAIAVRITKHLVPEGRGGGPGGRGRGRGGGGGGNKAGAGAAAAPGAAGSSDGGGVSAEGGGGGGVSKADVGRKPYG
jgi:hypothetical protein